MAYFAELSASGLDPVRFEGSGDLDCLCIAKGGIEGWWSTPAAKVNVTARGQGDGGHDVSEDDISYASRTVTLHWNANASSRDALIALIDSVRKLVHRQVTMRVVDSAEDTYCRGGYLTLTQQPGYRSGSIADSTITLVFERPERLSTLAHSGEARASVVQSGGLSYGAANGGLAYPLQYGVASDGATVMRLPNQGTSRAYPTYTLCGEWPDGCTLRLACDGRNSTIAWPRAIHTGTPVLLDTRSRTATMGGVDVTSGLSQRGWMTIPAGKSLTVNLATAGSGWVSCSSHDTYI